MFSLQGNFLNVVAERTVGGFLPKKDVTVSGTLNVSVLLLMSEAD